MENKTITTEQKTFFYDNGYLHVPGVISGDALDALRAEFDRVWEVEGTAHSLPQVLKHAAFLDLIEHPGILSVPRAIFGENFQLLQADLLRQGPKSAMPERAWHRDFTYPGDYPVSINSILYMDDMTEERGLTRVVPGSHRGEAMPPRGRESEPLPGEVAVYAKAGDVVYINSAIWHTGGRNVSEGLRRGIYLYYGYWWLRRFDGLEGGKHDVPSEALQNAGTRRLQLLGIEPPVEWIHMYEPTAR